MRPSAVVTAGQGLPSAATLPTPATRRTPPILSAELTVLVDGPAIPATIATVIHASRLTASAAAATGLVRMNAAIRMRLATRRTQPIRNAELIARRTGAATQ